MNQTIIQERSGLNQFLRKSFMLLLGLGLPCQPLYQP